MNEADTCREYVVPRLVEAGWDNTPHSIAEQRIFTDGRVFVVKGKPKRGKLKKADYLLRYTRDFPIAVVEAMNAQLRLRSVKKQIDAIRTQQADSSREVAALFPSILDHAFQGQL